MFRSTHSAMFLLTVVLFTSTAHAQGEKSLLRRHANKDGQFEAMMPANTRSVQVTGKMKADTHYVARGKAGATEFRLKVQLIDSDPSRKIETAAKYVDLAREQLEKSFGRADRTEAVVQHSVVGREFLHRIAAKDSPNGKDLVFQQRVIYDGQRLYTATHIGSPDAATAKMGRQFLDSVRPLQRNPSSAGDMTTAKTKSESKVESSATPLTPAEVLAERIARTRGCATYVSSRRSRQIVAPMHFGGGSDFYTILIRDDSDVEVSNGIIFVKDGRLTLLYSDEIVQSFLEDRISEEFLFDPVADSENGVLILRPVLKNGSPHRIDPKDPSLRYTEAIREIRISDGGDPRLSPAQRLEAFAAGPRSKISFSTEGPDGDVILVDDTTAVVTLPDGNRTTNVEKGTYRLSGDRLQFTFGAETTEFAINTTKDDGTLELKAISGAGSGASLISEATSLSVTAK